MAGAENILLVEDSPTQRLMVEAMLAEAGDYRVETAASFADAVKALARTTIDVVLLDLHLPDSTGLDTLRGVVKAAPGVAVVIMTSISEKELGQEAMRSGAGDYLLKDLMDAETLCRALRYAVERQRATNRLREARDGLERRVAERTRELAEGMKLLEEANQKQKRLLAHQRIFSTILQIALSDGSLAEILGQALDAIISESDLPLGSKGAIFAVEGRKLVLKAQLGLPRQLIESPGMKPHGNYCAPIAGRSGVLGVLDLHFPAGAALDAEDIEFIAIAADALALAIQRRKSDEELQQLRKIEALGKLAGGMAHEINNMLTPILAMAEFGIDELREGDPRREGPEIILLAARRIRDLVEQVLLFSRKEKAVKKSVKVQRLLVNCERLLRTSMPAMIKIDVSCDKEAGSILANRTQIESVLLNLATNAVQAMGKKGGILDISAAPALAGEGHGALGLEASEEDGYVCLCVHDTGPGMDESTKARIFEPFFTTKGPGEGTGLGLSVAHGIVAEHGGAIAVDSEPGKGSTFRVYLPMLTSSRNDAHAPQAG